MDLFLSAFLAGLLLWIPPLQSAPPTPFPPNASVGPFFGQPQQYPLSCEIRSAVDVANFWGHTVTEDQLLARTPHSDDPNLGFVGAIDAPAGSMPPVGYGIYAAALAHTLRVSGMDARSHYGFTLDELKAELVKGRPVILWSTYDMRESPPIEWRTRAGKTVIIVQWEHSFVATGYDETGVWLVDAYDGLVKHFEYAAFERAWAQLDRMAVTVNGRLPTTRRYVPWKQGDYTHYIHRDRLNIGPW